MKETTMPPEQLFPTSKVKTRILALLSDGKRHLTSDLKSCLEDELSVGEGRAPEAVYTHVRSIRKVLREKNEDIILEWDNGETYYRHVRIVPITLADIVGIPNSNQN